jgi:hypothetical protein
MMGAIASGAIQAQKMARDAVQDFKAVNEENLARIRASEEESKAQAALQEAKSEVDQFRRDLKLIKEQKTTLNT